MAGIRDNTGAAAGAFGEFWAKTLVLTTNTSAQLLDRASRDALVFVLDQNTGFGCCYMCRGSDNNTSEMSDPNSVFVGGTVFPADNANQTGICYVSSAYQIKNAHTTTKTYSIFALQGP